MISDTHHKEKVLDDSTKRYLFIPGGVTLHDDYPNENMVTSRPFKYTVVIFLYIIIAILFARQHQFVFLKSNYMDQICKM